MSDTILKKIGVTDKVVSSWLKKGLTISYPMVRNKKYYKSEDGFAFVENGDKYVIPLSKKEILLYTKNPKTFKRNFLKNVDFYVSFINWLNELRIKTAMLQPKEKFISLLALLYLFQRAMDHHYYHFDRYLVYQNYPDTPVGFWWNKLKKISQAISAKEKTDKNIVLLHLLSTDKDGKRLKKYLGKKQSAVLDEILKNIKIFETTQESEINKLTDLKTKENLLFRTAVPIWNDLKNLLKKYPELIKSENQSKISEIIDGHPLIITRLILSPEGLNYFDSKIFMSFEEEIKRWV